MGMEKMDFLWYVKKMSFLALIGYLGGAGVNLFTHSFKLKGSPTKF
jgi:hypothetical protein